MLPILDLFARLSLVQATTWLLVANFGLFVFSLGLGYALRIVFRHDRLGDPPDHVQAVEIFWAISCVLLNTLVAVVGWWLWRHGWIMVRRDTTWRSAVDVLFLLMVMDLGMYVTHRIAHHRWFYPWIHRTHHSYRKPHPLHLFVLNPFEVCGFGALWLAVLVTFAGGRSRAVAARRLWQPIL